MSEAVVAALIPARAGSEGVPGKNVIPIHGRSLLERAIACAQEVPSIGYVYVTTDDPQAKAQADRFQVRVIDRPSMLATSDAPMLSVVLHALEAMNPEPDYVVLLQPTTPTRTWQMIEDAIRLLEREPQIDSVVSVTPLPRTHAPDMVMCITGEHLLHFWAPGAPPSTRQEASQVYIRDGSLYAMRVSSLRFYHSIYGVRTRPYIVKANETLNIDTHEDWKRAQQILD